MASEVIRLADLPPEENGPEKGKSGNSPFDRIKHLREDGSPYWIARELFMGEFGLGYTLWQNVRNVIKRAINTCRKAGYDPANHFIEISRVVRRSQGGGRKEKDVEMSRYGCYISSMEADSSKSAVALAKTYFAARTHQAEVLTDPALAAPTPGTVSVLAPHADPVVALLQGALQMRLTQVDQGQRLERVEETIQHVAGTVQELVQLREEAARRLGQAQRSGRAAPPLSTRSIINSLVNGYVAATNQHPQTVWTDLYRQLYYRCHVDIFARSKYRPGNHLDEVEALGLMETLYDIASEVLRV